MFSVLNMSTFYFYFSNLQVPLSTCYFSLMKLLKSPKQTYSVLNIPHHFFVSTDLEFLLYFGGGEYSFFHFISAHRLRSTPPNPALNIPKLTLSVCCILVEVSIRFQLIYYISWPVHFPSFQLTLSFCCILVVVSPVLSFLTRATTCLSSIWPLCVVSAVSNMPSSHVIKRGSRTIQYFKVHVYFCFWWKDKFKCMYTLL